MARWLTGKKAEPDDRRKKVADQLRRTADRYAGLYVKVAYTPDNPPPAGYDPTGYRALADRVERGGRVKPDRLPPAARRLWDPDKC